MKFEILIDDPKPLKLNNLHNYLARNSDGEIGYARTVSQEGEMSTGLIIGISAVISSLKDPIAEFIK